METAIKNFNDKYDQFNSPLVSFPFLSCNLPIICPVTIVSAIRTLRFFEERKYF